VLPYKGFLIYCVFEAVCLKGLKGTASDVISAKACSVAKTLLLLPKGL
jgi:hypothetical protein